MNLTTLFEKIADKPKQREESRIEDFRSLVTAIVAGKQPDPERVEAVLAASGQTLDDIRAAVELRHRRIALKATLDTAPKLRPSGPSSASISAGARTCSMPPGRSSPRRPTRSASGLTRSTSSCSRRGAARSNWSRRARTRNRSSGCGSGISEARGPRGSDGSAAADRRTPHGRERTRASRRKRATNRMRRNISNRPSTMASRSCYSR